VEQMVDLIDDQRFEAMLFYECEFLDFMVKNIEHS
jgi:hypothetical protein